jgi:hypothetical protein
VNCISRPPRGRCLRTRQGLVPSPPWAERRNVRSAYGLEHTGDRYELLRDGAIVRSELHERSPATRSYTRDGIAALVRGAGFADVRLVSGFTDHPAGADDTLFCVIARRGA